MRTAKRADSKSNILREHASLNAHPEQVTDVLFQVYSFFDARDLVQVRYEMLRRVIIDRQPVQVTATAFGFSRMTLNQLRKRFEAKGLVGLLPQHKGPKRAYKLTSAVMSFLEELREANPEVRPVDLQQCVVQRFGVSVHPDNIERALRQYPKKESQGQRWLDWRARITNNTSDCGLKHWRARASLRWHLSSAKG